MITRSSRRSSTTTRDHELDRALDDGRRPGHRRVGRQARRLRRRAALLSHSAASPRRGGVTEEHTTLLPLFHYGRDPDESLFILPGYFRRVTHESDTLSEPVYSQGGRRADGATSLTAVGPVVPLWWDYSRPRPRLHAWALAPFFYSSDSPAGHDWLTPLVGHFETYGAVSTWWVFPTLTLSPNTHGWENDLHPLVYVGRSDDSSHTVVAPIFWDFANPKGRTTVGFPLYWRFADGQDDSVIAGRGQHALHAEARGRRHRLAVPLAAALLVRRGPAAATSGTCSSGSRATRAHGDQTQTRVFWIPFNGGTPSPDCQDCRSASEHSEPRVAQLPARDRARGRAAIDVGRASSPRRAKSARVARAASRSPIASRRRDGSAVPALHALPRTRPPPRDPERRRAPGPSSPGTQRSATWGAREAPTPLTRAPGARRQAAPSSRASRSGASGRQRARRRERVTCRHGEPRGGDRVRPSPVAAPVPGFRRPARARAATPGRTQRADGLGSAHLVAARLRVSAPRATSSSRRRPARRRRARSAPRPTGEAIASATG